MDSPPAFIFDLGWIFFAAWAMVLAAVSAIAFGKDLVPGPQGTSKMNRN
jgi:hypothetical protein